ncbi:uncharacterized protein LOC141886488 isoform X1 [Acropora palmata]|uniref:uncharacterized protein LOC141886488 isoform X1 n=1 Tax=Acropora palmata TaxID=6131 RepID=UPI003DA082A1
MDKRNKMMKAGLITAHKQKTTEEQDSKIFCNWTTKIQKTKLLSLIFNKPGRRKGYCICKGFNKSGRRTRMYYCISNSSSIQDSNPANEEVKSGNGESDSMKGFFRRLFQSVNQTFA